MGEDVPDNLNDFQNTDDALLGLCEFSPPPPLLLGGGGGDDFDMAIDNLKNAFKNADSHTRKQIAKKVNVATQKINDAYISEFESSEIFDDLVKGVVFIAAGVLKAAIIALIGALGTYALSVCVIF